MTDRLAGTQTGRQKLFGWELLFVVFGLASRADCTVLLYVDRLTVLFPCLSLSSLLPLSFCVSRSSFLCGSMSGRGMLMSACMYMGPKGRQGKVGMDGCCHFALDTIALYHGFINCKHLNLCKGSKSIELLKFSLPVQGKTLKLRALFHITILMIQVEGEAQQARTRLLSTQRGESHCLIARRTATLEQNGWRSFRRRFAT